MTIPVYNQSGEKVKELSLPEEIFGVKIKGTLIHQALIRQLANRRVAIAHTKTRGLVRGGGRKPYRQKGTGHARQGSIRSPHYKGGGVVFGPTKDRNFQKMMPKKQRRLALFSLLSSKARDKKIMALESYFSEKPKTKLFADMLIKLGVKRKALIVLDKKDPAIERSSSNIPNVKTILVNYLNPDDILKYDQLLFLEPAIKKITEIFIGSKAEKKLE